MERLLVPLPPDATLDYLVTRCRWFERYLPSVFEKMDGFNGDCQVRLAVDGKTFAPDYRIEMQTGAYAKPLAVIDGIYHTGSVARANDGRTWSSEAMTWREVGELAERLRGMLPKIVETIDADQENDEDGSIMKTVFLLMAQYDGAAIIPIASVVKDYFPHMSVDQFARKATLGEIKIPLIQIEPSRKSARGVHVQDLADYIEARRKVAKGVLEAFTR